MRKTLIASILGAALSLTASADAFAEKLVALSIGVSNYVDSPLPSPVRDAVAMAHSLAGFGFDVTLVKDPTAAQLRAAVLAFAERARDAEVATVYFSGHGAQANGVVYLAPRENADGSQSSIFAEELSVAWILAQLERVNAKAKIILVDACRSPAVSEASLRDPAARATVGRAEAFVPGANTLVGFASSAGQHSQDWFFFSAYTWALLDIMDRRESIDVATLTREARKLLTERRMARGSKAQVGSEVSSLEDLVTLRLRPGGKVTAVRPEGGLF